MPNPSLKDLNLSLIELKAIAKIRGDVLRALNSLSLDMLS